MKYRIPVEISAGEDAIQKTIAASKAAFAAGEAARPMSSAEFLYQQSRYIRKCWWMVQALLLLGVCLMLHALESDYLVRRTLGIAAPLFATLILPEFWKNRNCDAMEVEKTTFFTLRQIYAARLTLFAGMDLLLLTAFFLGASLLTKITVFELLTQFLLPFNVTCCICFRCLYGGCNSSEALSILLCAIWTGLWVLVVLHEAIYDAISVPMWMALLASSAAYLGYTVRRGQQNIITFLEAKPSWN